jgi:hypothetical protein
VVSGDGRYRAVVTGAPASLAIHDNATGEVLRKHLLVDRRGAAAPCARVLDATSRRSFVIVLDALAEAWEVSYADRPEPVYEGLVHDYRMGEGLADTRRFALRRIPLDTPLEGAWIDASGKHLLGALGERRIDVINLDVRRRVDSLDLDEPAGAGAQRPGPSAP